MCEYMCVWFGDRRMLRTVGMNDRAGLKNQAEIRLLMIEGVTL